MAPSKGKEKVFGGDNDKTGGRKRKDRGVLQFFEDSAFEFDVDESSDDDLDIDDYLEDEFDDVKVNNEPAKAPVLPFIKEEEMDEEELEKMVEERYGPGSSFVTYADDGYESTRATYRLAHASSSKDPALWKVKCMVGRERHSVFCLMQKFVDLRSLGTKLHIISAFSLDHVKGFIFIEADKQNDVNEACKGLTSIYSSRVVPVPKNEISHVLSVRSKSNNITKGMWARVKNGKYKGDLGQVVAVNEVRKKVTVKLIPRIDLRALAEKFGGGVSAKKTSTPAPRLISSSELEEFRPLIQLRRDRDTNKMFEILDGMMLKDGYLYKKVSIDSLSIWGVTPTEDELLKFEPSNNDESNDLEWLSNLYGDRKKKQKRIVMSDKGVGKGEGSSSSNIEYNFEVHDLVFFGRKDFGVIVGMEKDDSFKIMKEGSEGPIVVTIPMRDLKNASFDKKLFTALDQHSKAISINDTVKVLDGPLKDRQGVVKQIYRGTIFLYNESEQENNGYLCIKSLKCEKVISPCDESHDKGSEPGPSGFGDFSSSPKSPLSPKKSWEGRENSNFNREDKNGMFSVGQSLRIRVGPLKGYLCRVLAVRRSDVTVKLDSQQKILTVKCEHLSEVRGKSSATSLGKDHESLKPFDLLGTTDGSSDWMGGAGMTAESGGWNVGGLSTEGNSWPAFPSSSHSLQPDSGAVNTTNAVDGDAGKGDSGWESKPTSRQNPEWGAAGVDKQIAADTGQVDGWGKQEDGWKKAASTSVVTGTSDSWGKAVESRQESTGQGNSWGRDGENWSKKDDSSLKKTAWNSSEPASEKQTGGWANAGQPEASGWKKPTGMNENQIESWSNKKNHAEGAAGWGNGGPSWGKTAESQGRFAAKQNQESSWGDRAAHHSSNKDGSSVETSGWKITADSTAARSENWNTKGGNGQDGVGGSSWSKPAGGSSWSKPAGGSSWGQQADEKKAKESHGRIDRNENWGKQSGSSWSKEDGGSSWSKQGGSSGGKLDGGSSWNKRDSGSSWSKPAGGSSWSQQADTNAQESKDVTARNDNWGKQEGGSSWSKQASGSSWNNKDGGSSWSKPAGGSSSSWGQQGNAGSESKGGNKQNDNWAKQEGGSSWSKQEGGSSWNSKQGGGSSSGQPIDAIAEESRGDKWGKQEGGSSWSKPADVNAEDQSKGKTNQNDSWSKSDGSSSWNKKDGGSSWNDETGGGKSSWDSQKASQDNSSAWNVKKTSEGGSSTGWGQSNRWNSGVDNAGGNQNSAWSSKSNWNSGSDFGGSQEQTDNSYCGRGRGGNWRGGRGGRGGRGESYGSFGGRDGSEQGGFGGRDGSEGGGFGGRGRFERGGFGGRGRSDRGGFRGRGRSDRGGFGGRGRGRSDQYGDWNKRNDSGEDKPQSWSSNTAEGGGNNDYRGSWNQGGGDSGQWKSWSSGGNQLKGDVEDVGGNAQAGWSKQESSWKTSNTKGGWNDQKPGWGQGSTSWSGSTAGTWNKPSGTDGAQAKQGNGAAEGEGPAGCNAQAGWSRQENSWKTSDATGGWNQGNTSRSGSLGGSWNKPSGSDGGQPKQGNGAAEGGPADSWGKAAPNSWGKANDGGW